MCEKEDVGQYMSQFLSLTWHSSFMVKYFKKKKKKKRKELYHFLTEFGTVMGNISGIQLELMQIAIVLSTVLEMHRPLLMENLVL